MFTFWTRHRGTAIFVVLGILAVLPFLLISFYCNPVAGDDFNVVNMTRRIGVAASQEYWYKTWTGRYFSTFLATITPLLYGNFFLYKIIPIVILGLLGYSFYFLLRSVIPACSRWERLGLASGFMAVLLLQMPSTSEGIFWAICSYTYQLPNALTLLFLWAVHQLTATRRPLYFLLSVFFSFAVIGSAETSMLVLLYLLVLVIFFNFLHTKKMNAYLLGILALSILFSIIVMKAPGNSLRQQHFPNAHRFPGSIILTLKTSFTYLYKWLPVLLMSAVIVSEIIYHRSKEIPRVFQLHPLVSFVIFLSLPCVCIFPVMWAVGNESVYLRIANVAYFFTVVGFFYFAFTLFFFLSRRYPDRTFVSSYVLLLATAMIALRFFTPDNTYQPNNVRRVYMDLISGRATIYNRQFNERIDFISKANADTCLVPEFRDIPSTLLPVEYHLDIVDDPTDWRNKSLAEYFNKKAILRAQEFEIK